MKLIHPETNHEGRFTPGDPTTGQKPTRLSAEWCNSVQFEIANVIKNRKLKLDSEKDSENQLYEAIGNYIENGATPVDAKTFPLKNGVKKEPLGLQLNFVKNVYIQFMTLSSVSIKGQQSLATTQWFFMKESVADNATVLVSSLPLCGHSALTFETDKDGNLLYSTELLDGPAETYAGYLTMHHFLVIENKASSL